MATITAAMVKELREKTGAGMMDCKQALTETNGDIEAAIDWLRKKGLSKAAKKSGRIAAEGLDRRRSQGQGGRRRRGQLRDRFRRPQRAVPGHGAQDRRRWRRKAKGDAGQAARHDLPGQEGTVEEHGQGDDRHHRREHERAPHAALERQARASSADYVHNQVADGLGKIGVLVALESAGDKPTRSSLGRQIAMHVAAANPLALNAKACSPKDVIEREKRDPTSSRPRPSRQAAGKSSRRSCEGRMRRATAEGVRAAGADLLSVRRSTARRRSRKP